MFVKCTGVKNPFTNICILPLPLQVRLDATARSIVTEACSKLHLNAAMYDLCEVKSSGEKVVLRGDDISVHSEMSVNGRLFIVPRTHSEKTLVRGGRGRGKGY